MRSRRAGYFRNRHQALRTAKHMAEFIQQNIQSLRSVDHQGRMEKAALSFLALLRNGKDLTSPQYSYLEGIYERTMGAMGLPSINVHSDRKPRGLKFG